MKIVPIGCILPKEAIEIVGKEKWPTEWSGEEWQARAGLISKA